MSEARCHLSLPLAEASSETDPLVCVEDDMFLVSSPEDNNRAQEIKRFV